MKNENIVIIVVIAVLAFFILAGGGMMGYGGLGMMGSYWIFGPIIMILVVVTLILFILWLIRQLEVGRK